MVTETQIWEALRAVIDPEIGINVVDLGLVYGAEIRDDEVHVAMTMTTEACPLAEHLVAAAEQAIRARHPDVARVRVEMVWEPPWSPAMMSDAARRQLGWSG
jgi:metal-sulfur cluster biosynthetic enzyme